MRDAEKDLALCERVSKEPLTYDERVGCVAVYSASEDHNCLSGASEWSVYYAGGDKDEHDNWYVPEGKLALARLIAECPEMVPEWIHRAQAAEAGNAALVAYLEAKCQDCPRGYIDQDACEDCSLRKLVESPHPDAPLLEELKRKDALLKRAEEALMVAAKSPKRRGDCASCKKPLLSSESCDKCEVVTSQQTMNDLLAAIRKEREPQNPSK